MSDSSISESSLAPSDHAPYDRSPRRALDEISAETRAEWHNRYVTQAEGELRVQVILDRAEATLKSPGTPATIRTHWIALADRAGRSEVADMRAAAALAGMAMGLRPT